MPQSTVKNGPQLGIRLDRTDQTYIPGETIVGHIFRQSHIVASNATLRISLHARSKSRMVARHGHITSTYRGRFDLVKSADYTQTIFQGPLHITADGGEQVWPFSLKLPTHIDLSALDSGVTQDQSYLSLSVADALTHRPPPTFFAENYEYMSGMSAFVEYVLEAELKTSSRGSSSDANATLPFKMLYLNSEPNNAGQSFQISHHTHAISSSSLLVGQEAAGATSQIGDSPELPTEPSLVFNIQVQAPTVLQIDSPDAVPFSVLAVPDLAKTSGNVQYNTQEIWITQINMSVVARTEVKCPARKATHQADIETQINLHAEDAYLQHGSTLIIPWKAPATQGQTSQEAVPVSGLNVGEKIGLRLGRSEDLCATFQTYNIQHTHRLRWKMTVQVAGKTFELSGEDAVTIMSSPDIERSTEWIQPPSEDRLPSFTENQPQISGRTRKGLGGVGGLSRLWAF